MKKRIIRTSIAMLLVVSFVLPSFAATYEQVNAQFADIPMEVVLNEYDAIVEMRTQSPQALAARGYSTTQIQQIQSNEIEQELLRRATLSDDELENHYGYTQEQINLLRKYDGTALENAPYMRRALANMRAGTEVMIYGTSRMGVMYHWEWTVKPAQTRTDIVAVTWDPTFIGSGHNNASFDSSSSQVTLHYRRDKTTVYTTSKDLTPYSRNQNASCSFDMTRPSDALYWAESGELYIYVKSVNTDNPPLNEVAFHFKYGHQEQKGNVSVSFPAGISISFSTNMVEANFISGSLKANGAWVT